MPETHNVLFISYDGLTEYLGQSQILAYMLGIAKKNNDNNLKITIFTYEKPEFAADNLKVRQTQQALDAIGLKWIRMTYHKRPKVFSTVFDIFLGILTILKLNKNRKIKIIHARSYVAGLIAVIFKKACKAKFIFDMRGFWVDERIEAGIWKNNGFLYKLSKYLEKIFLQNADTVVSLTRAAKTEIEKYDYLKGRKINIICIPTCVDLDKFSSIQAADSEIRKKMQEKIVFVYSGSISTWFMPHQMLDLFGVIQKNIPQPHLLVLTREGEFFKSILAAYGFKEDNVTIINVDHPLVPGYLSLGRAGFAFYKPGYSKKARCPTKIGEYLACGLPVIVNAGIGDTDEIIKKERVGIIMEEFSSAEYGKVNLELKELLKDSGLGARCRKAAQKYFSLDSGIEEYRKIYRDLLAA